MPIYRQVDELSRVAEHCKDDLHLTRPFYAVFVDRFNEACQDIACDRREICLHNESPVFPMVDVERDPVINPVFPVDCAKLAMESS